jgi:cytochrome c553
MLKVRSIVALVLVFSATGLLAANTKKSLKQSRIERGRYLTTIAGCNDCHTPKLNAQMQPDMSRQFSGRPPTTMAPAKPANPGEIAASPDLTAWYGPWGVSYAANLTPDPVTGIGKRYNEASFIKTLRTGKKPEGEDLLPPMPWPMIGQMTDEDLKSVYAYLCSIKPVSNNVKTAAPPPGR